MGWEGVEVETTAVVVVSAVTVIGTENTDMDTAPMSTTELQ